MLGQIENREIILIGNRKIKRQRICQDVKAANFKDREFKWGYSIASQDYCSTWYYVFQFIIYNYHECYIYIGLKSQLVKLFHDINKPFLE